MYLNCFRGDNMDYDVCIENNDLTIYCSNDLEAFSHEFINYFNENIERIKKELSIDKKTKFIVALTDDESMANFIYGKSGFSGFFTDTGAFAYINLNGNRTKDYILKGLMHELTHYLYKYYVYGEEKERITWVDEGIAQFFSGQKDEFKDEARYRSFLDDNLKSIDNIDLNMLNHKDKSFGNNNGYNLSYIAVRYLYETNKHDEFIDIIKNYDKLMDYGKSIISSMQVYYHLNNKHIRH